MNNVMHKLATGYRKLRHLESKVIPAQEGGGAG